ncbi:MAG: hypothetical protein KC618_01505, partial [Candidatus Omnitrophica bacterium]|nr:hypothetical protein [Candidatus Omnitrophota bacterium]
MSEIKEIEIKESVLGHLLYFFIFISKKFQGSLSQIFWWVFIKPFLLIGKLLERTTQKEHQRLNDKTYLVLDNFNRSHRIYFKYLKFVFEVNRIISGVSTQDKVYKKLVNWNKSIPLMGFRHDRTTYNIMMLKDKYKDGREIGEHISLGSNNYHGKFKILLKN